MRKVNYKELKNFYFKPRDSWSERLIIQKFSAPLAYLILNLNQSKKLPYFLTGLNPALVLSGGILIYLGFYWIGGLIWLFTSIIDNLDGVIARFIFGKDPQLRGTLDITFDTFNGVIMLQVLFFVLFVKGMSAELFLLFLFLALLFIYFVQSATTFRILSERKINQREFSISKEEAQEYLVRKEKQLQFLTKIYLKIGNFAKRYRMSSIPGICDACFLVYFLPPLLSFRFVLPIMVIGILFMTLAISKQLIINYILIQKFKT